MIMMDCLLYEERILKMVMRAAWSAGYQLQGQMSYLVRGDVWIYKWPDLEQGNFAVSV